MKQYVPLCLVLLALLSGCKSEKKINNYSTIYSEKPVVVYIAPLEDKAERKVEKFPKDITYNNEVNTASAYLYQTMAAPLLNKGYYVISPVASNQIAAAENRTAKQWRTDDLKKFHQSYGIDAVLIVTLHRWVEKNGEWIAYLEYRLRSTKSNNDMMHTWVKATKEIPKNLKGNPAALKKDNKFAKEFEMDNGTAQRCFIMEKVNDYILRDLPTSSSRRQFEKDIYDSSVPTYLKYTWTEDGGADVSPFSLEEFEQECFI